MRVQQFRNRLDVYEAWLFARGAAAGAPATVGERSMVDALRKRLGISKTEARKRRRTSNAAADERIRDGMSKGSLNAEQAADLAGADVDEDTRSRLIDDATTSGEGTDTTRRKVNDAERHAAAERGEDPGERQRRRRSARRFVDRDGMWNLHLSIDADTGAQIDARLSAANKRLWHHDKDSNQNADKNTGRSPAQRMADAAVALLLAGDRAAGSAAANTGTTGAAVQSITPELVVTVGLDVLADPDRRFEHVTTTGGVPLTVEALRRAACDTRVIPVVLGSKSEVLDLGRAVRTATRAQRRALAVRDGGCVWPGCDTPPAECDAHHVRHWVHGGASDLANLALMCHTHHRLLHEGGYELWARPPDPETGQPQPGWMIHDSGGMPRWPTQHRHQPGRAQTQREPTTERGPAAPSHPDPPNTDPTEQTDELAARRSNGDVTWNEPTLFADTG